MGAELEKSVGLGTVSVVTLAGISKAGKDYKCFIPKNSRMNEQTKQWEDTPFYFLEDLLKLRACIDKAIASEMRYYKAKENDEVQAQPEISNFKSKQEAEIINDGAVPF